MRRLLFQFIFICLILTHVSCSQCAKNAQNQAPQQTVKNYFLSSLGLEIQVPLYGQEEVEISSSPHRVVIVMNPRRRAPFTIEIEENRDFQFPREASNFKQLRPDLSIQYRLLKEDPIGSGGEEQTLEGVLTFGTQKYHIHCHAQEELEPPRADFCLPILSTLRLVSSP